MVVRADGTVLGLRRNDGTIVIGQLQPDGTTVVAADGATVLGERRADGAGAVRREQSLHVVDDRGIDGVFCHSCAAALDTRNR